MTLRAKTLLVITLTLVGLLALLFVVAQGILLGGFARLEAQEVRNNVQRVQEALAADLEALNTTASDYAAWDDTYAFVADGNAAYAEDNLSAQTFSNLRLNVLAVINAQGELVFGRAYDLAAGQFRPLPAELEARLRPGDALLDHRDETDSLTGLLHLPEGPLMVAARPILTSEYTGPIGGTLLMGRYLNDTEVARLAAITRLALLIETLDSADSPADVRAARPTLTAQAPVAVRPLDAQTVAGYTELADLEGTPILVLRVSQPRVIYQEGQATVAFFILALLAAGLVFGLSNWFLLERFVLSRLAALHADVRQVGERGDASLRVRASGGDELGAVATAINNTLAALAQAHQALRDSEAKFRKLAETSAAAIFIAQGARTRYANSRAEVLTGYTSDDLLAMPFHTVVPPDGEANGALPGRREVQIRQPEGGTRWLEITAGSIDYEGEPAVIATAYDITDRKHAQEGLQSANSTLTALIGQLEMHNHEAALLSQMSDLLQACPTQEESYAVIARFLGEFFPGQAGALFLYRASRDHLLTVAATGDFPAGIHDNNFATDACWALRLGRVYCVSPADTGPRCSHVVDEPADGYVCVPIIAQSEALGVLHVRGGPPTPEALPAAERLRRAELVGERLGLALANANLRETLRHQAIRDPLTGLFNRRYMQETLGRELSRAARNQRPLGLLFLDLDHFKDFNDTHGHDAGDALLRQYGGLLRTRLRAEDIVCRFGGEEFVLIMPEAGLAATLERAEAVRADTRLLSVKHFGQVLGAVTVSIGVAMFPEHGANGELLIRAADQALYRAKERGRDRVVIAEG